MNLDLSTIIPAMTFTLYIVFTLFGIIQGRKEKGTYIFILYMFMMSIWSFSSFMMHANTAVLTPLKWNRLMMIGMLGVPITMFHALLNMTGDHKKRVSLFMLISGYTIYLVLLFFNFTGRIVEYAGFTGREFTYRLSDGAILAYSLCYIYIIFALIHLSVRLYKAENKILERKLRFPMYGVIILLVSVLVNLYEPLGKYPIDILGTTLNALFIFYAIYNYKLISYSSIVLRSILIIILVMISSSIFYFSYWVLSLTESTYSSDHKVFLVSLLFGILVTIIFQPLRKGTLSLIEKLYLGKRFNSFQELKTFSHTLSSLVDLRLLGELTTEKISTSYRLNWSAMIVQDYSTGRYLIFGSQGIDYPIGEETLFDKEAIKEFRKDLSLEESNRYRYPPIVLRVADTSLILPLSLVLPLKFKTRTNGYILLGKSEERDFYNQFDLDTLEILQGQCAITLENAISFERLRNQQKKLQNLNQELTVSRNKLEAFFDGITTPIAIQDINYNIVMVNFAATKYFNAGYDQLVGQKCYRAFFNREKPCHNCLAQDCLHTQLPFESEQIREKSHMIFDVHFYPISVPDRETKIFLEFFQDVTQQKKLQADLIQSEKLAGIGTMASGIAHEINNPLGGILGTAEIIQDQLEKDSPLYDLTNDIINYSLSAASVLKDLTIYSRKEKGELNLIDIPTVIEDALRMAERGMDMENIEILKDFEPIPPIEANQNSLQQVLLNLISNAVQSMPTGGTLQISCSCDQFNARIDFKDTGTGIEKESLDKIFDPFYTTKDPENGTGLGLSISHHIITEMGGRIRIKSKLKEGTEITVNLPLESRDKWKIRFVIAKEDKEKEDVFFLQRKILVGELGYREESIRRTIDEKAFHILAYKGLQPVGTVSCITTRTVEKLPIEDHFSLTDMTRGRISAEIDRLAVLKEERGSIIPIGLMTLAYIYTRMNETEVLFLDVFAEDKKQVAMYDKLGYQRIGQYRDPALVDVMILDHRTEYERKRSRMEHFVKPLVARLIKLIQFDSQEKQAFLEAMETMVETPAEY